MKLEKIDNKTIFGEFNKTIESAVRILEKRKSDKPNKQMILAIQKIHYNLDSMIDIVKMELEVCNDEDTWINNFALLDRLKEFKVLIPVIVGEYKKMKKGGG